MSMTPSRCDPRRLVQLPQRLRSLTAVAALAVAIPVGLPALPAAATPTAPTTTMTAGTGPTVPVLRWQDCEEGFECATARVPLDHIAARRGADGAGRTIELALIRLPARVPSRRIGSLFTNPGGPGGSGVDFVRAAAKDFYTPAVRDRFDIVGFDPRGVGASTPVRCFASTEEQTAFATDLPLIPVDDAELRFAADRARQLARLCRDRAGALLQHVSTANVARDLDLLRAAVGDEQLSYAGYSYGTYLGATYANLFPDRVRALVLDGVVDAPAYAGGPQPSTTFIRQNSHLGSDETLDEFFRLCAQAASRCSLARSGDPRAAFEELAARLRAEPLALPGGFELGYDELVTLTVNTLYAPAAWNLLADLLQELSAGTSAATAQQAAVRLRALAEDAAPGDAPEAPAPYDNARESQLASICVDSRNPRRVRDYARIAEAAEQQAPFVASYWTFVALPCAFWPAQDRDRYRGPWNATTSAPALLLTTTFDPATPLRNARTMRDLLPGSRLVEITGWGHTSLQTASPCADGVTERYLLTGELPAEGLLCPTGIVPFSPATNIPTPPAATATAVLVSGGSPSGR